MTKTDNTQKHKRSLGTQDGPAPDYNLDEEAVALQHLIDVLFAKDPEASTSKIDILTQAELDDLGPELMEIVELLPARNYKRAALCDQLNSIITAHGWGLIYGTVE